MEIKIKGYNLRILAVGEGAFRVSLVRDEENNDSGLNRYQVFKENTNTASTQTENGIKASHASVIYQDETLVFKDNNEKTRLTANFKPLRRGFDVSFDLTEGERLYGMGDVTRDRIEKSGFGTRMWVRNVKSYAPIPYIMSSGGWAVLLNTTFDHYADIGEENSGKMRFFAPEGALDFYLFIGDSFGELLERYTAVAGRPSLLPRWAFGLTFVCNTHADDRELVSDALNFRREDIPCDLLGLEPGWMEINYDGSVNKKWSDQRFLIPSYVKKGPNTFLGAIDRLGFKLSLWLCCDYDVSEYEESLLSEKPNEDNGDSGGEGYADGFERDEHFKNAAMHMDRVTVPGQPWFEHLKKFVDQGAAAFKLDGAYQVIDHPDRLWKNGMRDNEMHNLYPVILAKQMSLGFSEHTGKRSMIYTAGGYAGIQRYAATWAGDTGGGFGSLVSILNHGLSGHSNTSCDMDVFSIESIHFGFLQPWAQLNSWNYWRHPWLLSDEDKEIFRDYAKLRYSLVPYLYTAARRAYVDGMPLMRAMALEFPEDRRFDNCMNEYMLGDNLLVGAFPSGKVMKLLLPEGRWHDFWTGDVYSGPSEIEYSIPDNKGGPLLVRSGSIIAAADSRKYVGDQPYDAYILHIYGDGTDDFTISSMIYDDDGITHGYENGEFCDISIKAVYIGEKLTVSITKDGNYPGMPENINYTVIPHGFEPKEVIIE